MKKELENDPVDLRLSALFQLVNACCLLIQTLDVTIKDKQKFETLFVLMDFHLKNEILQIIEEITVSKPQERIDHYDYY